MSGWSDFTSVAKSALLSAQKRIDNVLDIREEQDDVPPPVAPVADSSSSEEAASSSGVGKRLQTDFFAAFGLSAADAPPADAAPSPAKADSLGAAASSLLSAAAPQLKIPSWFGKDKKQKRERDVGDDAKGPAKGWGKWLGAVPSAAADDHDDDDSSATSAAAQDSWIPNADVSRLLFLALLDTFCDTRLFSMTALNCAVCQVE